MNENTINFRDEIKTLAKIRKEIAECKDEIQHLEGILLSESQTYVKMRAIQNTLKELSAAEKAAVARIKPEANKYEESPHPAIRYRNYKVVKCDDDEMLDWAIEHRMKSLLDLNKKAVTSFAKSGAAPEFVQVVNERRVTIDTDLSPWLED